MKIKKQLIKRQVGGDSFLIPLGTTVYDHNGIFILTELGAFIWDILPSVDSEEEILTKILNEYDVDEDIARKDLEKFMLKLKSMDII